MFPKERIQSEAIAPAPRRKDSAAPCGCVNCGCAQTLERSLGNAAIARMEESRAQTVPDPDAPVQTISTATTSGNAFDITFDPRTTTPRPAGDQIQFIQSIQISGDGAPILPGTFWSGWRYRDPTVTSDNTFIDHLSSFRTPYLGENGQGAIGFSNSTGAGNATFHDAPDATGGGDRGFRSGSNPTGWGTIEYKFQTLAFCTSGTDCGRWYDGVAWIYTKTAADNAAGRNGVSTGTGSLSRPGSSTVDAFNQFNSVKGFTPCTRTVVPGPPGP